MGWASAGEIFDPVAAALIEAGASDDLKRRVLGMLIDKLQDGDWDTEDESLSEFAHDQVQHDGDGEVPGWMLLGNGEAAR
jgi:hypothetical protein